uniref:Uncharacterized protein n=1 Tax=Rangifer tarandus platyrhynchus TaxID=3082113 RepID=A0ACB0ELP8_RANTA|nr:unnamed protein product [Rangifer tarandus platyrhynchus]
MQTPGPQDPRLRTALALLPCGSALPTGSTKDLPESSPAVLEASAILAPLVTPWLVVALFSELKADSEKSIWRQDWNGDAGDPPTDSRPQWQQLPALLSAPFLVTGMEGHQLGEQEEPAQGTGRGCHELCNFGKSHPGGGRSWPVSPQGEAKSEPARPLRLPGPAQPNPTSALGALRERM